MVLFTSPFNTKLMVNGKICPDSNLISALSWPAPSPLVLSANPSPFPSLPSLLRYVPKCFLSCWRSNKRAALHRKQLRLFIVLNYYNMPWKFLPKITTCELSGLQQQIANRFYNFRASTKASFSALTPTKILLFASSSPTIWNKSNYCSTRATYNSDASHF